MKVSIITVVRNAEDTIEKTILSVINQNFDDYEYIIIDGLSTDSTNNIITRYKKHISKYISEKDNGIYDAMNKAILLSEGEWIYFLGADDTLYSNHTFSELFADVNTNIDVFYGDVIFKNSGKIFDGEFDYNKMCISCPCHQAVFYKKELFNKFGLFNLKYKINADAEMHIKTFCADDVIWSYKNQVIAIFNDTGISSVKTDIEMRNDCFELCYNNFIGKADASTLARICFTNFFRFCIHNNPKSIRPYLISIFKNVGLTTLVKVFFVRLYENISIR